MPLDAQNTNIFIDKVLLLEPSTLVLSAQEYKVLKGVKTKLDSIQSLIILHQGTNDVCNELSDSKHSMLPNLKRTSYRSYSLLMN